MEDRICPLMAFRSALSDVDKDALITPESEKVLCFTEKCAWYDFIENKCCLMTISDALEKIQDTIGTLAIKS